MMMARSPGELRQRHAELAAYALSRLRIGTHEGSCAAHVERQLVDHHSDGAYAILQFRAACPRTARRFTVDYQLFDLDPQHRGLARVSHERATQTAIFSPEASRHGFDLGRARPGRNSSPTLEPVYGTSGSATTTSCFF